MKTKNNTKQERDLFELSSGNLKVLETIPKMMTNPHYRKELRRLVLEFIVGGEK
jgi:hypothetical protein